MPKVDRYLFGSFGKGNDMCVIAALSLLDQAPYADIQVTLDRPGAKKWAPILTANGVEVEAWTPGDPAPARVAELIEVRGLPPLPKPIVDDFYADHDALNSACVAYFQLRMLQLYIRGGARLDADTLTFWDPGGWLEPRSTAEFSVAAYTRAQACCGIVSCRRRHPLLLDWYRRRARRLDMSEEPFFNARLKRWRHQWPIRFLHFTMPTIFDVHDKSALRGRWRMAKPDVIWNPDTRLEAPVLHYVHSGQDSRIPGSPPYRFMTVRDVLDFPLDGAGAGNIVIGRARRVVERFGLARVTPRA